MKHLLGIDAGGTKCSSLVTAPDGTALKWNCFTKERVTGRHLSAVLSACQPLVDAYNGTPLCVSSTAEKHLLAIDFKKSFLDDTDFIFVSESDAALALAGENHGIVLLAGTGAFTHLLMQDGRTAHLDGMGPLTGDFGGGFWIGQHALRAATRSSMHPKYFTSLARIVQSKITQEEFWRIAVFNVDPNDRMTVASLAAVVNQEAEAGDRVSREILFKAAQELAETVFAALDNHNLLDADYPLAGTGSVICKSTILWNRLTEIIGAFAPNLKFIRLSEFPAVLGVTLAGAKKLLEPGEYEQYRAKLLASFSTIQ